jgi:repressor LexA
MTSGTSGTTGAGTTDGVVDLHAEDDGLTPRQRLVLETVRASVESRGYPPSMREIGDAVGLTSPSSVKHQLMALERKGYLRRDPNRPRAIEVVQPDDSRGVTALPGQAGPTVAGFGDEDSAERDGARSSPSSSSRTCSRSPASSSARASCSCSRWSATR